MARRFTWWEAEKVLPRLGGLLRQAVDLKQEYQAAEQVCQGISTRIMLLGGADLDRAGAAKARKSLDHSAARLKEVLENIQQTGCVIKDLDIGLVDFPTTLRGREVYLCWKLGEQSIGFWHGTEEGFAGRKPIDGDFLRDHRGE